jgi:hypothetical protein
VTAAPWPPDQAPADAVARPGTVPPTVIDPTPAAVSADPDAVTLVEHVLEAPATPPRPSPVRRPPLARRERDLLPAPEPTVHVSIGRVEVRAVTAPVASAPTRSPASGPSLEDYLRERAR